MVASKSALHFFDKHEIEREHEGKVKVWTDEEEWAVSRCSQSSVSTSGTDSLLSARSRDGQE